MDPKIQVQETCRTPGAHEVYKIHKATPRVEPLACCAGNFIAIICVRVGF